MQASNLDNPSILYPNIFQQIVQHYFYHNTLSHSHYI